MTLKELKNRLFILGFQRVNRHKTVYEAFVLEDQGNVTRVIFVYSTRTKSMLIEIYYGPRTGHRKYQAFAKTETNGAYDKVLEILA